MYKEKELVAVKTTGELVYVLSMVNNPESKIALPENKFGGVIVRRAINTEDGIQHNQEEFSPDELETIEEHLRRELAGAQLREKLMEEYNEAKQAAKKDDKEPVLLQ